ncbi:MAG: S1/P1 nuclease [Desulfomonile tiedjei]|nr:S1/P1 nuclease [Desulfomonile tiedjei]
MRSVIALLSGICFLVAAPMVQAWNKPGHMTSAAIAYADLKERNPEVIAKVIEVLNQNPLFESEWAPKLEQVSADDRDLYLFMLAARWSDDVRGNPKYDRPVWHYVNIPYCPGETGVEIPQEEGILKAFQKNRSIVKAAAADGEDRAVALCWMFHLMGDVHQPLHTTKLVTDQFPLPEGDRGGTRFYIRVTPDSSTISLHQLWDGLILGSDRLKAVKDEATLLRNKPDLKRDKFADELAVKSFSDWAVGTCKVAIDRAYCSGSLQGSNAKDDGVVLPSDYKGKAKEAAERQIVLSGYRISDAMFDVFGE